MCVLTRNESQRFGYIDAIPGHNVFLNVWLMKRFSFPDTTFHHQKHLSVAPTFNTGLNVAVRKVVFVTLARNTPKWSSPSCQSLIQKLHQGLTHFVDSLTIEKYISICCLFCGRSVSSVRSGFALLPQR